MTLGPSPRPPPDARYGRQVQWISRLRRSHYGERWLEAADEAIAEGWIATRKSYSPSRSRSYVLVAVPLGREPSQKLLDQFARETMTEHGTESCLVVGASAASIRGTYEAILRWCRGEDAEIPEELLDGWGAGARVVDEAGLV